ncbi:MAG: hypothetical protein IPN71_03990 [Fibrobacteres bacterium]|nr:hypothetical protein [Fibrobacterota bacterium]
MKAWVLVFLALGPLALAQEVATLHEAIVRFPVRIGDCPPYEEFRRRGYDRFEAGVVHPLRMLARTQAEAEKARCEQMRTALEASFAKDWSGWDSLDGFVVQGSDSIAFSQARTSPQFDAVHALSLEVTGLDVVRNGHRFEHLARYRVVVSSQCGGCDSVRTIEKTGSVTGFGELPRAVEELSRKPRDLAKAILDGADFGRRARVVSVDSAGFAPSFAFLAGPGSVRSGRRYRVLDPEAREASWGFAYDRLPKADRAWAARLAGGRLPSVGCRLQEIPGDLAWRTGLALVPVGSSWGGELRLGPRLPIAPSVRMGLDLSVRSHDFGPISPPGARLGWGGGVGLEPDVSFQQNYRRWTVEGGLRAGLRLDLAPVPGSEASVWEGCGWARRGEVVATAHVGSLYALDPGQSVGVSLSWDLLQGRGAWDAPQGDIAHDAGAKPWRVELQYHFWPGT